VTVIILETGAGVLAKAVLSRVGGEFAGGLVRARQDRAAFERAIVAAARAVDDRYRDELRQYDASASFFEHEGADEIARLLLPGRGPDARNLARACAGSLGVDGAARTDGPLVAAFASLIDELTEQLGHHPPFRQALAEAGAARSPGATAADERELAEWIVARLGSIDTAGIGANEHLVLALQDVFVAPMAVREPAGEIRWPTRLQERRAQLAERMANGELSAEEYEAHLDRLDPLWSRAPIVAEGRTPVLELLRDAPLALVLGDPGSGKTTLLQHVAVQHARALRAGDRYVSSRLGPARLPIYVRIGEFARWRDRSRGLHAFLPAFLSGTLECPVEGERLRNLLATQLRAGRCIVLLDGLDEVTSARDRAAVVQHIASFVAAHHPHGNRFVCTSRISGYAVAPLPATFTSARLLEMDDTSIEAFVRGYLVAIEQRDAGAPADRDAEAAARRLLDGLRRTPGVRRLAANPLLLTALLLVHRTRGDLPQRRVDAYRAVADALGHTWRAQQGVPDDELPDDRRVAQWLTRLGDWMHAERPEGSVTLRDLVTVLGPLWATLQRQPWDAAVLVDADPASTEIGSGILRFTQQVEQQCGLLVERAPGRWGFPHLTFEEFYAGRALAFGSAPDRPRRIRARLHDARYDEPILLALGLVGNDHPEDCEALMDAAILGCGPEADRLDLSPSAYEDLLGRDFLFALRALADDVPTAPQLVDELLGRVLDEALDRAGRGRFWPYRPLLLDRVEALKSVPAGRRLVALLADRTHEPVADGYAWRRYVEVAGRCAPHTTIAERLVDLLADTSIADFAESVGEALRAQRPLPAHVMGRLGELALESDSTDIVAAAGEVLSGCGPLPAGVVDRLVGLMGQPAHEDVTASATRALIEQEELSRSAVDGLVGLVESHNVYASGRAPAVLASCADLPESAVTRLIVRLATPGTLGEWEEAAYALRDRELSQRAIDRLVQTLSQASDAAVASAAAAALRQLPELTSPVLEALLAVIERTTIDAVVVSAAEVIATGGDLPGTVVMRLVDLIDHPSVCARASKLLGVQPELPPEAIAHLVEVAETSSEPWIAVDAAAPVAMTADLPRGVIDRLIDVLLGAKGQSVIHLKVLLDRMPVLPDRLIGGLVDVMAATADRYVADRVGDVLGRRAELAPAVVDRLAALLAESGDPGMVGSAVRALVGQRVLPDEAVDALVALVAAGDARTALIAAELLGRRGPLPVPVIERMVDVMASAEMHDAAEGAGQLLGAQEHLPDGVIDRLVGILEVVEAGPRGHIPRRAADVLGAYEELPPSIVDRLVQLAEARNEAAYIALARRVRGVANPSA
jgi:hypothetical protein